MIGDGNGARTVDWTGPRSGKEIELGLMPVWG